jgi:hypothetical protein
MYRELIIKVLHVDSMLRISVFSAYSKFSNIIKEYQKNRLRLLILGVYCFCFCGAGVEPRASHMLGKCSPLNYTLHLAY